MIGETAIMPHNQTKAEYQASEDAYDLVYFEQLTVKTAEIRKSPKRFDAAVKHIRKENEERRKAMQKEDMARASATKK